MASFCDKLGEENWSGRCARAKQGGWEGHGGAGFTIDVGIVRGNLQMGWISDDELRRLETIFARERRKGIEGGMSGDFVGEGGMEKGLGFGVGREINGEGESGARSTFSDTGVLHRLDANLHFVVGKGGADPLQRWNGVEPSCTTPAPFVLALSCTTSTPFVLATISGSDPEIVSPRG
jgi:hypothetical protein